MTVAIIDYGSSNLRSAFKAFELAAENAGLKTKIVTNGLNGIMFSITWKYFQDLI